MERVSILVLADTDTHGDMGRLANALEAAKEFKAHGDTVQLVFDGAATRWPGLLAKPDHRLHPLYASVADRVAGACQYCARAFGAEAALQACGVPLLGEFDGHPSIRTMLVQGHQVLTF